MMEMRIVGRSIAGDGDPGLMPNPGDPIPDPTSNRASPELVILDSTPNRASPEFVIPDSTSNRASPEFVILEFPFNRASPEFVILDSASTCASPAFVILRPVTRNPMPAQASAGRRIYSRPSEQTGQRRHRLVRNRRGPSGFGIARGGFAA
jgi:hypothetical protein